MILSEDAHIPKPSKRIFDFALINTNSRRNESLMIGNSIDVDIIGAHNANIDQIWYNPYNKPCYNITPTYQVQSLRDIKNIL